MCGHATRPADRSIAKFYDNVEVYHQPGDNLDAPVNPNEPPKDGFYLRCNNLTVSKQERDGQIFQTMVAENNAFFRTPEFYGNAKTIKYDQSTEIIIFEGEPTILYKLGPEGSAAATHRGEEDPLQPQDRQVRAGGRHVDFVVAVG